MTRYEIIRLPRAVKGFKATLVDNKHSSGVSGIAVQWFVDVDTAKRHLDAKKIAYTVTEGK